MTVRQSLEAALKAHERCKNDRIHEALQKLERLERIESAADQVKRHWAEFGYEAGFDELMDKTLFKIPE